MAGIAKLISLIISLAALVTSVEALIRLVKFAWGIILKIAQVFKSKPYQQLMPKFAMAGQTFSGFFSRT